MSTPQTWVAIECAFTCRMCGFVVPLNHLDLDGAVVCARCGLEQAFEVARWVDAFRHAHAVGAGEEKTRTLELGGANAFRITARPGKPECKTCNGALEITLGIGGRADVTCRACARTDRYQVPDRARSMSKGKLTAVIAAAHESDRAAVKVEKSAGAIAVQCPSCNAALPPPDGSKLVTCKYCNTVSRIPEHIGFLLDGREPVAERVWLLFEGTTAIADEAARASEIEAARDERKREREARRAAERADESRKRAEEDRLREEARAEAKREEAEEKARDAAETRRGMIVAVVVVVAIAGGIVAWKIVSETKKAEPPPRAKGGSHGADEGETHPSKPTPPPPTFVEVPSCACVSRAGSAKNSFLLEAPAPGESHWYMHWEQKSGFVTSTMPFAIADDAKTVVTPAAGAKSLALAIACEGAIVALVGSNVATAFDGDDQKMLWTVKLPAGFDPALAARDAAAVTPTVGAAIDVTCPTALPVDAGKITLALAGGKRATISMEDGVLR